MEEVTRCVCDNIHWIIFKDRIECSKCGKEYKWPLDCKVEEATKAQDIINLVNDNY